MGRANWSRQARVRRGLVFCVVMAAVPFYGQAATLENVPKIKAELLVGMAENDERINAAWPAYEPALKKAGVRFEIFQAPGTQHGFNNDTTACYYNAAREVWRRTVALFDRHLRTDDSKRDAATGRADPFGMAPRRAGGIVQGHIGIRRSPGAQCAPGHAAQ